ncbi:MAG TPA: branched-chain amino acid ABC transporter ATP-binding protein/permease [Burkholderiales bacterium]|nr:branched-chain amino acid ABC transporter ATP-binding protein/permease [Burkholderiales bacterium]
MTPAAAHAGPTLRLQNNAGGLVVLAILAIGLPLLPYAFPISDYVLNIFLNSVTYAMAVLGMVVVLGYAGQINLAQAAFFGVGAYAVALGTVDHGVSFWISMLLGMGAAAIAGLVLGLTTLRLGGHYLAMITISFQQIFDLVMVNWIPVTHGPDGIAGINPPSLFGLALADKRAYLLFCAVVLFLLIWFVWWLPGTRLGRAMRAVRDNELAAETIGVHTLRTKVIAFTISAVLGGIGGSLYAAGFSYISPDNFSFLRSIEFLTAVLLGGAQSPFGAALGTVLIVLLPEWLRFLKSLYLAVYGLGVILIIVFLPEGIWGLLRNAFQRVRKPKVPTVEVVPALNFDIQAERGRPILNLVNLQKHFGGLRAVDGIDLRVEAGTVHALIGPNGSGKTTSLNVVNGIYKPTAGRIDFDGTDITQLTPHERAGLGMGRTFQNIRLFQTMTALENVMVGGQRDNNPMEAGGDALVTRALAALDFVGVLNRAQMIVRNLPYGHQRLVEIARALAAHPKLLLLDEPGAGLNQTEKQALVALLKRLRGHGLTIFLIDHDMGLVEKVSDTITVLNFGKKIAEGSPQDVLRHPDVIAAYLGEGPTGATARA